MIHCCKKVILKKGKACKEENGNIHRCILVSCDSYLSWLELMDQAMGCNLYDLACCSCLICSYVWNCKNDKESGLKKDCTLLVQSFLVVHFRYFIKNQISNHKHDGKSSNT